MEAVIIVIYNRSCKESSSCQSLMKEQYTNPVFLYDNSTRDMGNEKFCRENHWIYLSSGKNDGLSVAYNRCIQEARKNKEIDYICILDDDSRIDERYFDILRQAAAASHADVYLPVVRTEQKILSPCRISPLGIAGIFSTVDELKNYHGSDLSAINSGMAVKLSVYDCYGYDERVFLDGVDHAFMNCMKQQHRKIEILDYIMQHEFSEEVLVSKKQALTRFRIFARDMRRLAIGNFGMYLVTVGKRALRLGVQFHSGVFLVEFIRYWKLR